MKVLVVEDDPLVRDLAVMGLEDEGYEVLEAAHGGQALTLLQAEVAVDVLLTDIRMPDVNGWEVARAYRERFPDLPVLYVTGYAEQMEPVPGGLVLWKPYRMSEVIGLMATLTAQKHSPTPLMMKPHPILLVEDDPNDVELTVTALQEANITNEVIVLHDGQVALDFLRRQGAYQDRDTPGPAVVLLDLKLPKVSGLEVLEQIKSDPNLSNTPVVMLTSSREESDLVTSYDLNVNAFVVKPVGLDALIDTIKGLGQFWAMLNQTPATAAPREQKL